MNAFLKACRGRRFLRTANGRYIDLDLKSVKLRDEICVLFHIRISVILKLIVEDGPEYDSLIGDSFVHGKMDGSAVEEMNPNALDKRFKIFNIHDPNIISACAEKFVDEEI